MIINVLLCCPVRKFVRLFASFLKISLLDLIRQENVLRYERDLILPLSHENQPNIIEDFNATFQYLDDVLNIHNEYFEQKIDTIYPMNYV